MQRLKRFLTFIITISIVVSALGTMSFADKAADGHNIVCKIDSTKFKDANFITYINQNLDLDHDGYIDDYEVSQATVINVTSKNISSLSGIQVFTELKELYCSRNSLRYLDMGSNKKLEILDCSYNDIEVLKVNGNTRLTKLICDSNRTLTELQVNNLANLTSLSCNFCFIQRLNVSGLTHLTSLVCLSSYIEEINVSGCTALETLVCKNNYLSSIDVSSLTNLSLLNVSNNIKISSLDVSNNSKLTELYCGATGISELNVSNNPNLIKFECSDTDISSIDITNNTQLKILDVSENSISSIDVSNCPNLIRLYANYSDISRLDISCCPTLVDVYRNGDFVFAYGINEYSLDLNVETNDYTLRSSQLYVDPEVEIIDSTPIPTPTENPTNIPVPTGNPTVAPTTVPTNRPTTAPTTAPTTVPTTEPESESGVAGFVERLYTIALDRTSDPNGKADWVNRVYTTGATGADVAQGFLFSPEFLGKDMSNEEFLGVLYRVFFDRVGDQGGIDYWLDNMANGMDKQTVIWGFINSTEWANVCLRYGIASGGNGVPNITIEPSSEIIDFATRLYTTCLCRNADSAGLNDWATRLANRQISGSEAAYGFFFSAEFLGDASIDNAEFINRLYATFMNRPADTAGFNDWMNRMNNGASRQDVFAGFAGSQEWAGICSSYGILK